jgi:hypothetical protein
MNTGRNHEVRRAGNRCAPSPSPKALRLGILRLDVAFQFELEVGRAGRVEQGGFLIDMSLLDQS